jgi:hypothetical protein
MRILLLEGKFERKFNFLEMCNVPTALGLVSAPVSYAAPTLIYPGRQMSLLLYKKGPVGAFHPSPSPNFWDKNQLFLFVPLTIF